MINWIIITVKIIIRSIGEPDEVAVDESADFGVVVSVSEVDEAALVLFFREPFKDPAKNRL